MAGGIAQIHQAAFGEQDNALAVGELDLIDLRLHIVPLVVLQGGDLNFAVEMANIADDGAVLHRPHVVGGDDIHIAGGGDEDVGRRRRLFHGDDLVAFHRGLEGADRVNLGHLHAAAGIAQRSGRALAHIAIAADHGDLAGHHHIGAAADGVHQRFAAAIEVVEFRLGDAVIHIDGGEEQLALLGHHIEAVHARGGLFRNALDRGGQLGEPTRLLGQALFDEGEEDGLFLIGGLFEEGHVALLGLQAVMHQQGHVAAVVEQHIGLTAIGPFEGLADVIPVFLQRLALDGEDRHAGFGNGGRGVVLGGEDVAGGPADLGAERRQRLDQHTGLNGHVQAAGDAGTLERLAGGEFGARGHQARHFILRHVEFLAAPGGEGDVLNNVVGHVRQAPCVMAGP